MTRNTNKQERVMKITGYFTDSGNKTCSFDVTKGEYCRFLGSSNFGTVSKCMLTNEVVFPDGDNQLGYLIPSKSCPVWDNKQSSQANHDTKPTYQD